MNGHRQLVLDPLGYVQPVQVVMKQLRSYLHLPVLEIKCAEAFTTYCN